LNPHPRCHPGGYAAEKQIPISLTLTPAAVAAKKQIPISKNWANSEEKPLWQRDGWDTQLRKGDNYTAKWQYVVNNPVRRGLVVESSGWPYQGELNEFSWHE